MEGSPADSGRTSVVQTASSIAGLAGYVYVLGGLVTWVRLTAAHLPADVTTALFDPRILFAIGLRAVFVAALVLTVVCVVAYVVGRPHYNRETKKWRGVVGATAEDAVAPLAGTSDKLGERVVRTVAGLNVLVIALLAGIGVTSLLTGRVATWIVPAAFVVVVIGASVAAAQVGAHVFFGRERLVTAGVVGVIALFCETPIALLLLTSVAIAAASRPIARTRRPDSLAGFFRSPLPWALAGVYAAVAVAFVATPPVTYTRAVVTTPAGQRVGGYVARTGDGVYLATCTSQVNATSTNERVQLVRDADVKDVTLGGMPYRFDSGDRPSLLTVVLRTFGVHAKMRGLHVELRAAQPVCDAPEQETEGPNTGLGPGVLTGPAPPGGRAAGGEPPIATTTPRALAKLARRYQPTVEVTVADRFWPVSVSSVLQERGPARGDTVCLVVGGDCVKHAPAVADLAPSGSATDYLDYPATLNGDPTNQFLAFTRGQGIADDDATAWLAHPAALEPWRSAQVYFYYAGSADGIDRYGDVPSGLLALQYWFFYPDNYYPTVVERGLMLASPLAGDRVNTDLHEGDWEHVTVLVDGAAPHRARYLYMARHDVEGKTLPWDSASLSFDGTHPIVQAAFGGHPTYPNQCGERPRPLLKNQASDWVICATGRYGFRAGTTPLVDLARAGWSCWPGHFGQATAKMLDRLKLPESDPRRWDSKVLHVAGPLSPLRQAENSDVCARGTLAAENAHPIR